MSFRRNILTELNEEAQMVEQQIDPLKAKLIEDGKRGFEISSYEKQLIDLKSTHIKLSKQIQKIHQNGFCLLYTSPSPRDATLSRMPSSA